MISRTYTVRTITDVDRENHAIHLARAEARGDSDQVEAIKKVFAEREAEQGQQKETLICCVCGDPWLVPTSRGTSRPHVRRDWDRRPGIGLRELRKAIGAMQNELDRQLDALEPD